MFKIQQAVTRKVLSPGHPTLNRSNCNVAFWELQVVPQKLWEFFLCFSSEEVSVTTLPLWWHKLHSCFQAERVGSGWISAVITGNFPSQAAMTHIGSKLQWSYGSHWQRKRTCIQHFLSIKYTLKSLKGKESTADLILSVSSPFTELQVNQITPP